MAVGARGCDAWISIFQGILRCSRRQRSTRASSAITNRDCKSKITLLSTLLLIYVKVEGDNSVARELWFTQAILLDFFGMTYSGNRRLLEIAESGRNTSITICRRKGVFRRLPSRTFNWDSTSENRSCDEHWQQWIEQESRRRLGFCAYVSNLNCAC